MMIKKYKEMEKELKKQQKMYDELVHEIKGMCRVTSENRSGESGSDGHNFSKKDFNDGMYEAYRYLVMFVFQQEEEA